MIAPRLIKKRSSKRLTRLLILGPRKTPNLMPRMMNKTKLRRKLKSTPKKTRWTSLLPVNSLKNLTKPSKTRKINSKWTRCQRKTLRSLLIKEIRKSERSRRKKKTRKMQKCTSQSSRRKKKLAAAQKHSKKSHKKKKKHFKIEDDPSDKIEDTLTERAVIHKAVTKIDNNDGEDLINSFITESDTTSQNTNSWLSEPAEGQKEDDTSTASSASPVASNVDISVDENNKQDPLFLTKTLGI